MEKFTNEDIMRIIHHNNDTIRKSFRCSLADLNTFLGELNNNAVGVKDYFEVCIDNFNIIDSYSEVKDFVYKYTKDKSYTICINIRYQRKLTTICENFNLSESDVFRFILLKCINKN